MNSIKRIRLLVAIPNFVIGGAERVFLNIISNIDKEKFDLHLVVGELKGTLIKSIPKGIKVYELGDSRAYKTIFRLLRVVWQIKPDIIFATLGFVISAGLIKPLAPSNTKIVIRFGNTISSHLDEIKLISRLKYYFYYLLNYVVLFTADNIIVQSNYMKIDLIKLYSLSKVVSKKIKKINNPINMDLIKEMLKTNSLKNNKLLKKYCQPNNGPKLISVGRFDWQKGYDLLLSSFKDIRKEYPEALLIIIAEGGLRSSLEKIIKDYSMQEYVLLPGLIDNPYPFIVSSDIFISSSRYEGFSNAILESLALGIPVVATDCPSGIRELVIHSKNGWLSNINGNFVKNLTETIIYGLKNLDNIDMIDESKKIVKKFGVNNIVNIYENFFMKIAN